MNTNFVVANTPVSLRPAQPADQAFLARVYASTRADEMALVSWTDEQKAGFVQMQFDAQTEHYRLHYPKAEYLVIERDGVAIGRLIRELLDGQLILMDLTLLPEYRNAGIGTAILQDLMAEAASLGLPLVLRVEFFNPVIRLYSRLGFVKTREVNAVYHEMIWTPVADQA